MSAHLLQKLNEELESRSQRNPVYSLRAFSRSLGINSSTLSALLRGKRPITLKTATGLMRSLNLGQEERSQILSELAGERSIHQSKNDSHVLEEEVLKTVVDWENYAILALMETHEYKPSVQWIASQLRIGTGQVLSALERLKRVGLVRLKDGRLQPTHQDVSTTHDIPSPALKEAHRQYLEKAKESLETVSVNERDFSGVTFAISTKKLPEAKKCIQKFRHQMQSLLEQGDRDCVYRLNIQLFPIQKSNVKKGPGHETTS